MPQTPLAVGGYGERVAQLHGALRQLGFQLPDSEIRREFFGPATRQAVREVQQQHGVPVTGDLDERTGAVIGGEAVMGDRQTPPAATTSAAAAASSLTQAPGPGAVTNGGGDSWSAGAGAEGRQSIWSVAAGAPASAGTPAPAAALQSFLLSAAAPTWPVGITLSPEDRNVLIWLGPPPVAAPAVVEGNLVAIDGTIASEISADPSKPAPVRMCAFLGPGATPRGLGQVVGAFVNVRTGTSGAPSPLSDEVIAAAILAYNAGSGQPVGSVLGTWKVGRRLLLPLEQPPGETGGSPWITNGAQLAKWAEPYYPVTPAVTAPLAIDNPAVPLSPAQETADSLLDLPGQVFDVASKTLTTANARYSGNRYSPLSTPPDPQRLADALRLSILVNPFNAVFPAVEVFRQLQRDFPATALTVATALADTSGSPPKITQQQLTVLGWTTAGNAVLRRLWAVPGLADVTKKALAAALGLQPAGASTWFDPPARPPSVTPVELPLTAGQESRVVVIQRKTTSEHYRNVLGRRISVGNPSSYTYKKTGLTFSGFSATGKLTVDAALTYAKTAFPPGGALGDRDQQLQPAARIVAEIAGNEANLDGTNCYDKGLLSVGFQQWTVEHDDELVVLLYRFQQLAGDHFDLFFGLYGLSLDPESAQGLTYPPGSPAGTGHSPYATAPVSHASAQPADPGFAVTVTPEQLSPTGPDPLPLPVHDRPDSARSGFFGMSLGDGKHYTSDGLWAARARLAVWFSNEFRAVELQTGVFRFKRILDRIGGQIDVSATLTSQVGVAALLDQHINAPDWVVDDLKTTRDARPNIFTGVLDKHAKLLFAMSYLRTRRLNDKAKRDCAILHNPRLDLEADTYTGWLAMTPAIRGLRRSSDQGAVT